MCTVHYMVYRCSLFGVSAKRGSTVILYVYMYIYYSSNYIYTCTNVHTCMYVSCVCSYIHVLGVSDETLDEPVFADGEVICFGQIIGMVLAKSQPLAQRAAKAVKVTYDDLPSVITIEVSGRL